MSIFSGIKNFLGGSQNTPQMQAALAQKDSFSPAKAQVSPLSQPVVKGAANYNPMTTGIKPPNTTPQLTPKAEQGFAMRDALMTNQSANQQGNFSVNSPTSNTTPNIYSQTNYPTNNTYSSGTPNQQSTSTQTTPQSNPYAEMLNAVSQYSSPSQEILDLQQRNADLEGQRKQISTAAALGQQAAEERPIQLDAVLGMKRNIENRAGIQTQSLEAQQQTLAQKIANLQSQRQAQLDAVKAKAEAYKPVAVGGLLYQNQPNGTYKQVAGSQNASDQYGTGAIGEYNFAKANGYTGSFTDYQNEDANRKKSIASAGVGNTGLDSKQYTALNQVTTRFQADPIINQAIKGGTANAIADQVIANPGAATSQLKSLYVLVKNLDPDSAVREGELALASQTQSYLQRFGNTLAKIFEGRVISPGAAIELANATKELMSAWNQTANKRQTQYKSQANTLGISNEFNSYLQGSDLGFNGDSNNQLASISDAELEAIANQ